MAAAMEGRRRRESGGGTTLSRIEEGKQRSLSSKGQAKGSSMRKDEEEKEMTLNQKINKVIHEIKKINQEKALRFGCQPAATADEDRGGVDESLQSSLKQSEKLIDFIKKERRRDDAASAVVQDKKNECTTTPRLLHQYQTQQCSRAKGLQQLGRQDEAVEISKQQISRVERHNESEELSSLFDLTSAKRMPDLTSGNKQQCQQRKYYETYRQQLKNCSSSINIIPSGHSQLQSPEVRQHNQDHQHLGTQKQRYQKYEDILAGAGSLYQEGGRDKQKSIVEERFQGHSRLLKNPPSIKEGAASVVQEEAEDLEVRETSYSELVAEKWRAINQRTESLLRQEQDKNRQLESEVARFNQERQLVEHIIEEQDLQQQLKDLELRRMNQKTATLTKHLIREQCIKENLATQNSLGYSNPAKLMNFIKTKKSIANCQYGNVKQYVSHMEAFTKLSSKQSEEERHKQKQLMKQIAATSINCGQTLSRAVSVPNATVAVQPKSFAKTEYPTSTSDHAIEQGIKQRLEAQRKALRDFSNYYALNQ